MREQLTILSILMKLRITALVSITTAFGYILYAKEISVDMIMPILGIFLMAAGASALNHLQEYRTDAMMPRTMKRPVPSGKISTELALFYALLFALSGGVVLLYDGGLLTALLGVLALFWYNAIYTPLKKRSAFAVVPGSVIGAIPPVVGWVSAGGELFAPQILLVALFFFIWQIPHFWLLLLIFDDDYQAAGMPTLSKYFSKQQLSRLTFIWTVATAGLAMLLPLYGVVSSSITMVLLAVSAIGLLLYSLKLLRSVNEMKIYRYSFHGINTFVLLVMIFITLEKLVTTP